VRLSHVPRCGPPWQKREGIAPTEIFSPVASRAAADVFTGFSFSAIVVDALVSCVAVKAVPQGVPHQLACARMSSIA
jgi:hypothetical protein